MIAHVAIFDLGGGVVGKDTEALLHAGHIRGRVIDEEIDVFGETARAVRHDGEAANQYVLCTGVVQGPADADEVFRLGRACVCSIIWVIHASASSKLEKR